MLYIASDFGREKRRPAGAEEWGTSHDLNNGVITLSPLVNGNTILGGVDPNTGLTFGFDPNTGAPDPGRNMNEPPSGPWNRHLRSVSPERAGDAQVLGLAQPFASSILKPFDHLT